jgi:hypothetical protein
MSTQVFLCRLFGGRDLGIVYDSGAGTISILGQSIAVSSLSAALQQKWQDALNSGTGTTPSPPFSRPAFGGDNIGTTVGLILADQATWRAAVQTALTGYWGEQTGAIGGVDTFNRQ